MTDSFHIALTGHRPAALAGYDLSHPFYTVLRTWLEEIIAGGLSIHPHLTLHSGMALGADTVWAQAIVRQKALHPDRISFVAEIPVLTQPDRWPGAEDRRRWAELKDSADRVHVYANSYTVQCLHDRNRGMISAADLVLAIWNGTPSGGTAGAVRFARQQNIQTFVIAPRDVRDRTGRSLLPIR